MGHVYAVCCDKGVAMTMPGMDDGSALRDDHLRHMFDAVVVRELVIFNRQIQFQPIKHHSDQLICKLDVFSQNE